MVVFGFTFKVSRDSYLACMQDLLTVVIIKFGVHSRRALRSSSILNMVAPPEPYTQTNILTDQESLVCYRITVQSVMVNVQCSDVQWCAAKVVQCSTVQCSAV